MVNRKIRKKKKNIDRVKSCSMYWRRVKRLLPLLNVSNGKPRSVLPCLLGISIKSNSSNEASSAECLITHV